MVLMTSPKLYGRIQHKLAVVGAIVVSSLSCLPCCLILPYATTKCHPAAGSSGKALGNELWEYMLCQYYPKGNTGNPAEWTSNVGPLYGKALSTLYSRVQWSDSPGPTTPASTTTTTLNPHTTTTVSQHPATTVGNGGSTNVANKLDKSLFTMIIGLTIVGSGTTYPSVLISLLISSGFVHAIPQSSILSSLSSESESAAVSSLETLVPETPTPTTTSLAVARGVSVFSSLNTQAQPKETGFSSPAEFNAQILWGINWYRHSFGHPDLVWNDTLADWSTDNVAFCDSWHDDVYFSFS